MAILGGVAGTAIYNAIRRMLPGTHGRFTGALFAGWFSTVLASAACAGEVCLSGRAHATVMFPAMIGVHTLIGIGEGLITALVLESLARTNPELLADQPASHGRKRSTLVWGFLIGLGIAAFISPFACPWPDGLEAVAKSLGIQEAAMVVPSLIPDYRLPHIASPALAVAVGGVLGTLIMFLSAWGVAKLLVRRVPAKIEADL
jgi:cobalt/nickel transport system permease protein